MVEEGQVSGGGGEVHKREGQGRRGRVEVGSGKSCDCLKRNDNERRQRCKAQRAQSDGRDVAMEGQGVVEGGGRQ